MSILVGWYGVLFIVLAYYFEVKYNRAVKGSHQRYMARTWRSLCRFIVQVYWLNQVIFAFTLSDTRPAARSFLVIISILAFISNEYVWSKNKDDDDDFWKRSSRRFKRWASHLLTLPVLPPKTV